MKEEREHYRPSWDDYFMAIAKIVAARGTCDRLYASAVLVKNNRIISTGYNGSPPGLPHCSDEGHLMEEGHCVRTIHAEHNTVLQAAVQGGTSTVGSTIYMKYSPCVHCTKYLIAAGIQRIVYEKVYRNEKVIAMLDQAGVIYEEYKPNPDWTDELLKIFQEETPTRVNEGEVRMEIEKKNNINVNTD